MWFCEFHGDLHENQFGTRIFLAKSLNFITLFNPIFHVDSKDINIPKIESELAVLVIFSHRTIISLVLNERRFLFSFGNVTFNETL